MAERKIKQKKFCFDSVDWLWCTLQEEKCILLQILDSGLENIFNFFFNKRKRGRSFLHMFSMSSFPVLKNCEMREVAWRLTGLSQAKSTWALVRASAWGDCNSFFRIICLLNAESFIKMKKVSLNIVLSKEKSSYIIHWRFIYMQLLFWQWGNQMEIWNSSNRAAFRVTDDLWTSCLDNTLDPHTSDWMLLWTN